MLITNMTVEECRELLVHTSFGRLGCAHDNQPYVVPISFAYEPDCLYGFSVPGQKIDWMRSNPRVSVEVDEVTTYFQWKSVIITGRYEELPDTGEYSSGRSRALASLQKRYFWWQAAYSAQQLGYRKKGASPVLYCIHIDDMTGHSAVPDSTELRVPL